MKEKFETVAEAKVRRNELRDAMLFTQARDFEARYTHTAYEEATRYRQAVCDAVDKVAEWPGTVEWPEIPVFESQKEFSAKCSLRMEAIREART